MEPSDVCDVEEEVAADVRQRGRREDLRIPDDDEPGIVRRGELELQERFVKAALQRDALVVGGLGVADLAGDQQ